jgi:Family of unknown function (DUF5994)
MPAPPALDRVTSTVPVPQPGFRAPSAPIREPVRLSFDPALSRRGTVDGGWWPQSGNATAELPGLIEALDSQPGVRVRRLSVRGAEWDDIPRWLPGDDARTIRVDWFTTMPRHTVSVTASGGTTISLLVIPPATPAAAAAAAMGTAAASRGRPDEILATAQQAPA